MENVSLLELTEYGFNSSIFGGYEKDGVYVKFESGCYVCDNTGYKYTKILTVDDLKNIYEKITGMKLSKKKPPLKSFLGIFFIFFLVFSINAQTIHLNQKISQIRDKYNYTFSIGYNNINGYYIVDLKNTNETFLFDDDSICISYEKNLSKKEYKEWLLYLQSNALQIDNMWIDNKTIPDREIFWFLTDKENLRIRGMLRSID